MPLVENGVIGWEYNGALSLTRDQSQGKPGTKRNRSDTANSADKEDMPERLGNIHCLLKHDHTERNSRNPSDEAYLLKLAFLLRGKNPSNKTVQRWARAFYPPNHVLQLGESPRIGIMGSNMYIRC